VNPKIILHKNATTKKNGNPKHPSINKTYQNPSKNLTPPKQSYRNQTIKNPQINKYPSKK
jgi:hypothetical protein